jgi:TPR repeat protein
MDRDNYLNALDLERDGKLEEAGRQLHALADAGDPHALIELGARYYVDTDFDSSMFLPGKDLVRYQALTEKGRLAFLALAEAGDAEAMRMLGYYYLGLLGPVEKAPPAGEAWLLKAYEAGCHLAANDLSTYYLHTDRAEAKRWYQIAEAHGCRVIYSSDLET